MARPVIHGVQLDDFLLGYIEAALWSSNDESDDRGGEPLDRNYRAEDIHPDTLGRMARDCERFRELAGDLTDYDNRTRDSAKSAEENAGIDFWLTRSGAGAGFWDGGWRKDVGARLTELSKRFGEFDLYVGDDGQVHGTGGREI